MKLPLKAGVDVRFLRPELVKVLWNVQAIMEYNGGPDYEFLLTAGADGTHKIGSKHYVHLAVDLRTRPMTASQRRTAVAELKHLLDAEYDIVDEVDHIHLEYDPHP